MKCSTILTILQCNYGGSSVSSYKKNKNAILQPKKQVKLNTYLQSVLNEYFKLFLLKFVKRTVFNAFRNCYVSHFSIKFMEFYNFALQQKV